MKANKPTMTVERLRYLCVEKCRVVNGLNPSYMKNVFKKAETLGRNERNGKTVPFHPDETITNLAKNVLLLLDQKFGILFLLVLSPKKRLKCLKNTSKHGTEKCVSVICAHRIRITKSSEK